VLPVDSEHTAIFQCLNAEPRRRLRRVLLTASGGPFFGMTREQTVSLRAKDALRHPNWSMGAKITVDSATLMNKGFEFIEAMHLYRLSPDQIEILVHRESIIHSMVEYEDGSVMAQLSCPDMRIPIQYALTYPDRLPNPAPRLDLIRQGKMTFFAPDPQAFPCLRLAMDCAARGQADCVVLNGANEAAVAHFLSDRIPFGRISQLVEYALQILAGSPCETLEQVFALDRAARDAVEQAL